MRLPRCLLPTAATLALLTACSGAAGPLDTEELQEALLTVDNFGAGWVQEPTGDDTEDRAPTSGSGCLEGAEDLEAIDPIDKISARYVYTDGALTVASGVASYESADAVADEFEKSYDVLEDCTEFTNETGAATVTAEITSDQTTSTDEVDGQLNVRATGTIASGDQSQEFTVLITLARVGANVTTVQTVGTSDITAAHTTYAEIAIDRLLAVTDGDEPEETVAPEPDLG